MSNKLKKSKVAMYDGVELPPDDEVGQMQEGH